MIEKVGYQQIDTPHIRRKLFDFLEPSTAHDLKAFLGDMGGGAGAAFVQPFECSKRDNQFRVAVVKQLLLCLESPDDCHMFVVPTQDMLPHVIHGWMSSLNDLNLLYTAGLSRLRIGFRGEHGQPTTVILGSLDKPNRFRGIELASAVFYTAGDPCCRFSQSPELDVVKCRVRAGNCPQLAVVGSKPF